MHIPQLQPMLKPILAAAAMLVLMGLNVAVSSAVRGHAWGVFAVLPLALGQAFLLVFALMELPEQGSVPRVYLGLALILLAVAALSLTDYMTRRSALSDDDSPTPAGGSGRVLEQNP